MALISTTFLEDVIKGMTMIAYFAIFFLYLTTILIAKVLSRSHLTKILSSPWRRSIKKLNIPRSVSKREIFKFLRFDKAQISRFFKFRLDLEVSSLFFFPFNWEALQSQDYRLNSNSGWQLQICKLCKDEEMEKFIWGGRIWHNVSIVEIVWPFPYDFLKPMLREVQVRN